jgi:hypothetical protein
MNVQDLRDALAGCERGYAVVSKTGEIVAVSQNKGDKTVSVLTLAEKKMLDAREKAGEGKEDKK